MNDQQKLTKSIIITTRDQYYRSKKMYDKLILVGGDKKLTCMRLIHNDAMFYKAIYDRNKDALMKLQKKYTELSHKALEEDRQEGYEIQVYDGDGNIEETKRLDTDGGYLLKCNQVKENYDQREEFYNNMLKLNYWWI